MERLSQHPQIGGYGELLLQLEPGANGWSDWPAGAGDRPFFTTYLEEHGRPPRGIGRHRHLFSYLDYVYEPRRGFDAIGFKLMYAQALRFPEVLAYVKLRGVKVIHLLRTNLLDIALSRAAMEHRQFVHARTAAEREHVCPTLDSQSLPGELARIEREQRIATCLLRAMRLDVSTISYESLLAGHDDFARVLAFLGVDDRGTQTLNGTMLKLAPRSHREGIANYSEIAACLASTRFRDLLRD
jgi:hypothetical protein